MNDAIPNNLGEAKSFDYIAEANVTASNNFHGNMVPLYWLQGALTNAINAIEQLDRIKKTLFYGRELTGLPQCHEVTTACQHLPALIDADNPQRGELLLHSIVGTATEAGEQLEMLANVLFNGAKFDDVNFIEETGDVFWYAAIGLKQVNANFGDVQHRNIAKLRHRFPNKFTEYDANNRDLFGERAILETQAEALPQQPLQTQAETINRCAARGLRIEISGPTASGKTISAEMIKRLIPNATVVEVEPKA